MLRGGVGQAGVGKSAGGLGIVLAAGESAGDVTAVLSHCNRWAQRRNSGASLAEPTSSQYHSARQHRPPCTRCPRRRTGEGQAHVDVALPRLGQQLHEARVGPDLEQLVAPAGGKGGHTSAWESCSRAAGPRCRWRLAAAAARQKVQSGAMQPHHPAAHCPGGARPAGALQGGKLFARVPWKEARLLLAKPAKRFRQQQQGRALPPTGRRKPRTAAPVLELALNHLAQPARQQRHGGHNGHHIPAGRHTLPRPWAVSMASSSCGGRSNPG